jgi:para-nitrobenzyl esterase
VKLETGVLEGTYFSSAANEVAFLGVPYAAPPVGELRWKPPQPLNRWTGTRKATQFGPVSPQLPAPWLPYIKGNEDCLYLNIWTTRFSPNANLPVIVFFHGGGNKAGYSQLVPLGPALSRLGVVVVSANYRLGPFGFFAHPALTAESEHHSSGNYGLLDQLLALKWVLENISCFGGNPGQITVMGQSAGAVDIGLLMASPMSEGLFQGAIMESGDCQSDLNQDIRTSLPYNSISGTGESMGERLANDLGIADGPDALRNLRNVSTEQILDAWSKDRELNFGAIVDGWIVPEQPAKIFEEGKQARVCVLVGSNADEATVFGHNDLKTIDQYKSYLRQDTGKFADQEFSAYPVASDSEVPARYLELKNDFFAYGAWSMARAMTRIGQKAYLYYFTYAETGKRAALGAYHGEELRFVTDSFPSDWQHHADDEKLGRAIRTYWTQFAKTGDPNSLGLPVWPVYEAQSDQCLELGHTIGVRPVANRLEALKQIMEQILTETTSVQTHPKSN